MNSLPYTLVSPVVFCDLEILWVPYFQGQPCLQAVSEFQYLYLLKVFLCLQEAR